MDLNELIQRLGGTTGTISTVIVIVFALFVVIQALRGLKKGLFNQILHTGIMLVAAVASYIAANKIWEKFFSSFTEESLEKLISSLAKNDALAGVMEKLGDVLRAFPPETFSYLLALPAGLIIIPAIFSITFIALNAVLRIAYFILSKVFGLIKIKGLIARILAAVLGAAEGVIIATIILLPVTSAVDVVDDSISALCESGEREELANAYDKYITQVSKNPIFKIMKLSGGDMILNKTAILKTDEGVINLKEEFHTAVVLFDRSSALKDCDWMALNAQNKQALRGMLTTATASNYYSTIISGLLSGICQNLAASGLPFEVAGELEPFINDAILLFNSEKPDTVGDDLATLFDVYFILSDCGALKAITEEGDVTACLSEKNEDGVLYVNAVIDKLEENQRTKSLVSTIAKLSVTIMSNSLGLGTDADDMYDDLKDDFNDCLDVKRDAYATEEEYREDLSGSIDAALNENNISLEKDIVDAIADYVADNYGDKDSVSEDEFNDILFSYYDAYLEYTKTNP